MALSWISIDANSGSVIADLPTLRVDGALKSTLMRYEAQSALLPMGSLHPTVSQWLADVGTPVDDGPPPNWEVATREGGAFLVALDEEDRPLWGGLILSNEAEAGAGVALSLATPEVYLDNVYVGDETFYTYPQNLIVKDLVEKYAVTGALRGLPMRVEVIGGNGEVRGRTYQDSEDKTLYSVLQDLSGVIGGPEWTIGWEWVDGQSLGLVFYVGDRIGSPAPAGLLPNAQFHMPGSLDKVSLYKGFKAGEGANDVMAVSSGTEGARPQSPHQTNTGDFRPRFEYRWTPSTSITDVNTLTAHAQRALASMKDGSRALKLTANREDAPKLNRDWRIGDDIGFDITAPEFPRGLVGMARAVGWELTDTQITPLVDVTTMEAF